MQHRKIVVFLAPALAVFAAFLLPAITSCQHDPLVTDDTSHPIQPLMPCDSTKVYFQNDIMPYINSSCAIPGCHDNSSPAAGINLSNYENIMKSKVRGVPIVIPGDVTNSKFCRVIYALDLLPMPPILNLPLTNKVKQNFVQWVQDGALDNACDMRCDTVSYKYSTDIAPLMRKWCSGCHYGDYASDGILTTTYTRVRALVDSNNILYKCMDGTPGFTRMPTGNVVMPACDIIKVRKWIESGAPNN